VAPKQCHQDDAIAKKGMMLHRAWHTIIHDASQGMAQHYPYDATQGMAQHYPYDAAQSKVPCREWSHA